jgi:hypothetical protein
MINLDDVRHHTEVGTGYSKDKMLNLCADEIEQLQAKVAELQNQLNWLSNKILYCDYGDNSTGKIGWGVQLSMRDGKQFMFGSSISEAIDTAIQGEKE